VEGVGGSDEVTVDGGAWAVDCCWLDSVLKGNGLVSCEFRDSLFGIAGVELAVSLGNMKMFSFTQ